MFLTALGHSLDPFGLLTSGTALGRIVVVSQPHVDGLGLGLGSTAEGLPAFDPMDVWGAGGGHVFLGCERTRVTLQTLLWDGLVLEAGYGCGKSDLICENLIFLPTASFSLAFSWVVNQFS